MIALGDGGEVDSSGLTIFSDSRPLTSTSDHGSPQISPVTTVRTDGDKPGDAKLEFKLSQCFGDCSPAEEATQGNKTHQHRQDKIYPVANSRERVNSLFVQTTNQYLQTVCPTATPVDPLRLPKSCKLMRHYGRGEIGVGDVDPQIHYIRVFF